MSFNRCCLAVCALLACCLQPRVVLAQPPSDTAPVDGGVAPIDQPTSVPATGGISSGRTTPRESVRLPQYMDALVRQRLLAPETGSVERMRELVRRGEELALDERYNEASLLLFEVVESPRFADFVELEEFRGAEYSLAGSLEQLGARRTASRYLERILARGPEDPYFGPAYRRFVDVALESGDLAGAIERVEALEIASLPEDAENELRYLKGREKYDGRMDDDAALYLGQITRRSRFYANAQYLLGAIAARHRNFTEAEARFCSIASIGDQEQFSFYVDDRYFEVKDLAWLGLGRVAHEQSRSDDAFYYYFQVPNDSDRVAAALFESAYSMYEGGDNETAVDLLDQLDTRFPSSPYADEATLLRGYVHLGRCEFEEADRLFVRFNARFGPVLTEVDAILNNSARHERLYEELLAEERRARSTDPEHDPGEQAETNAGSARDTRALLLAMLRVDPVFYKLHEDVLTLDAEAARAGRLSTDLGALAERVRGGGPRAAAAVDAVVDESAELQNDLTRARGVLASLSEQIDTMRRSGAPRAQLVTLERESRALSRRAVDIERRLDAAVVVTEPEEQAAEGDGLEALLSRDAAFARTVPRRVWSVRGRMMHAANEEALRALRELRRRLGGELRRARIGRIDAVMGSKRRIEIQIESLAAGRFPAELQDPLRMQGMLRDDEEYWPFEGEHWTDEFDETDPIEELEDEL